MPLTLPNYGYQVDPQLAALANVSQAIQQGQRPVWGMNLGQAPLTAGEGAGAALQATGNVLADPRNAWMGLGPLAGVMRFRRVPDLGKDLGGFDIPYKQLFKQDPGAVNKESYVWGRDVENNIAKNMMKDPNGPSFDLHTAATEHYRNMLPEEQARITQSMRGQLDLRQEMLRQMNGVGAGDVPTDLQLRRFGYKPAPEQLGYRQAPPTSSPPATPKLTPKAPGVRYEVYDPRTGNIIGSYNSLKRAAHKIDKLDNEYGGVRYQYRRIDPPSK